MDKRIIIFIFALLLIPMVFAVKTSLGTFKVKDCIQLKQICANCTYVNITSILNPDGTESIVNVLMENPTYTNYNYTYCTNYQLGNYIVNGYGDPDGLTTIYNYDYTITTTGKANWNALPLFLLLGGFIIFGFASYLKNEYIGLLSGFLLIIAGVYMMIYGLGILQDTYTQMIAFVTLGIGLMVCFIAVVEMAYGGLNMVGGGSTDD